MTHDKFDKTYKMFEQTILVSNEIDDLIDLSVHNDDDYLDEIMDLKAQIKQLKTKISDDLRNGVESESTEDYA